jgi:repressor LexA
MLLTERQTEILEFLRTYQSANGITPTVAEVQEHFGFKSPTAVSDHLSALERKGSIRRTPGQARNIRLVETEAPIPSISIPIYGTIPAGFAEIATQESDRAIAFDAASLRVSKSSRLFGLDVRGDSMIGAGILDGDVVILEHGPEPVNGDIVAALIDNETTLKRYQVKNRRPFLHAENPSYPDLVPVEELMIQGIYRGLIRVSGGGRRGSR